MPRRTIWLTNDHERRVLELASRWGTTFSGTIARLVDMADVGLLELGDRGREARWHGVRPAR